MSERKARELWIGVAGCCIHEVAPVKCDIHADMEDHLHVREVLPDDELDKLLAENTKRREAAAVLISALVDISFKSHSSLANKDTEFHNKHAREALARYDEIMMKGGE